MTGFTGVDYASLTITASAWSSLTLRGTPLRDHPNGQLLTSSGEPETVDDARIPSIEQPERSDQCFAIE